MKPATQSIFTKRYTIVTDEKAGGVTYTPKPLADFVARQIVALSLSTLSAGPVRLLDPAIGSGELLISLLEQLKRRPELRPEVYGFETNSQALSIAAARLREFLPQDVLHLEKGNFLEFVIENFGQAGIADLFSPQMPESFDIIIANPPYIRTQIMGASQAQLLAKKFALTGRIDAYYAFLMGMAQVLKPRGVAGIIISNRFMTTKSGAAVRASIKDGFNLRHIWDLGDTKLFNVAVLPAVLLVEGRNGHSDEAPVFTSIYETDQQADCQVADPIEALEREGIVEISDGRRFRVQRGKLDTTGTRNSVWRIATEFSDAWLATVNAHSWGTFRDIGKIRVGVKTCADKVFIRSDWHDMPPAERPELLRPLTTHHIAGRFKAMRITKPWEILYPHEVANGHRRTVDLKCYPRTTAYLERHRVTLESRKYVLQAGRQWFEIWVPQDPAVWNFTKLVFRDIAEKPAFWLDQDGTIVNGDCYWVTADKEGAEDLLWLAAAVGNSTFIEAFYDHRFHNKLYAGRRRFITQYVEQFPLPDPKSAIARAIVAQAKAVYGAKSPKEANHQAARIDGLVWKAFGLTIEEIAR